MTLLILFAGRTGLRAVLSFFLTVLMIWKVLVPLYLKGWDPVWVGLAVTLTLTVLIIALVYGFDRRCIAAVSGSGSPAGSAVPRSVPDRYLSP